MLMLVMGCCQAQELDLVGGATNSIFRQAEAWILADSDHYNALSFVASRKKQDNYHSVMDFLFAEVFLEHRKSCQHFYEGKGPPAREILTADQIAKYDRMLFGGLQIAHEAFCNRRAMTWVKFRLEVLKLAA